MRSSSILFVSVLEKLETIRPEHGGRQLENLNFTSFAQPSFTEEQRGSCSKSTILITKAAQQKAILEKCAYIYRRLKAQ